MTSLEAKREQFRKYLERCGVIDSLSKALIKLYEESNKPDDAIRFIRKNLCEQCPDDEEFDAMKADLREANTTINELERELNRVKGNIKRSPSEVLLLLKNGIATLEEQDSKSLIRKYLTPTVFEEIKELKSFYGANLADCLNAGFVYPKSQKLPIYVGDHDCYKVFNKLLDPIIREYHKLEAENPVKQPATDWGDPTTLKNIDPEGTYVKSTKIRISRNMEDYPLFPKMKEEDFKNIMDKVTQTLMCMEGEYDGAFYPIELIDSDAKKDLVKSHVVFDKNNKLLDAAGGYRFWPTGRGTYYNPPKTFAVWVNEEDHLQIISMSQTANLPEIYKRLVNSIPPIEKDLKFRKDDEYGYLTANPINLGTTLRASVHISLPKLSADFDKLCETCESLNIEARLRDEEIEPTLEISNRAKLGVTEIEIMKNFQDAILQLIAQENEK